jgi:protein TonB
MFRYISAGFLSVAIHFLIFSPLLDQPAMALPLSQQPQSVSISFATPVKPTPKKVETPVPEKPQPVVETPTPKKVEMKKPVKKTVKKRIVKQKTVTKKVKKETPKKVIAKVEKKPEPVKKPTEKVVEPKEPIAKATPTETKKAPKEKITENKQQTVKKNEGLQEKPQLIQKSRFLSKPTPPKYPRLAKRKGIEGTVTYEVWLDEKGKQVKLLLKDSSGAKVLDVAALKAIKKWKFSPHTINGKSIAHRIYIPISFKLD